MRTLGDFFFETLDHSHEFSNVEGLWLSHYDQNLICQLGSRTIEIRFYDASLQGTLVNAGSLQKGAATEGRTICNEMFLRDKKNTTSDPIKRERVGA